MSRIKRLSEPTPCFYCGTDATGYDHVIPFCINGNDTEMVPCCPECNKLLSSFVFDSAWDKKRYIHEKLQTRYAKLLRMRKWEPEELRQFEGMLREEMRTAMRAKEYIEARIEYASTCKGDTFDEMAIIRANGCVMRSLKRYA